MSGERIVVRVPNWLGDCIMATPMLRRLRQLNPGSFIAVVGIEDHRAVFEGNPNIDRLMLYDSIKGAANFLRACRDIRSGRFEIGYVLPNSLSSAALFLMGGVKQRVGYDTEGRGWMLKRRIPWPGQVEHRVIRYLRLFDSEPGLDERARAFHVEMYISDEDRAVADGLLRGVDTDRAVAFNPCSITPTRRWFPERFAQLADRINEELDLEIVLVGGPSKHDSETTSQVQALSSARITNLAGRTTIKTLAAVLGRLRLLVTCNTGTMHIASTAEIPMVILPGSSDIDITAPWGVDYRVIHKDLDCYPCWKNECPNSTESPECMTAVTVDDVLKEVSALMVTKG